MSVVTGHVFVSLVSSCPCISLPNAISPCRSRLCLQLSRIQDFAGLRQCFQEFSGKTGEGDTIVWTWWPRFASGFWTITWGRHRALTHVSRKQANVGHQHLVTSTRALHRTLTHVSQERANVGHRQISFTCQLLCPRGRTTDPSATAARSAASARDDNSLSRFNFTCCYQTKPDGEPTILRRTTP